jgi:hypothetical protein
LLYLESKIARVFIKPTRVQQRQNIPDSLWFENLFPGDGSHPAMSQGASNHCHCLTVNLGNQSSADARYDNCSAHLHAAALVPQVQTVLDAGAFRETAMLLSVKMDLLVDLT